MTLFTAWLAAVSVLLALILYYVVLLWLEGRHGR